jgi:uncharacterized membrane protein YjjP (DUF1212 family)
VRVEREFKQSLDLITAMATALQSHGIPAHRLEEALGLLASNMGLSCQFFSTPTAVFASLSKGSFEKTVLLRVNAGDIHLERLAEINAILERVARKELDAEQALVRLRQVLQVPERWGPWWTWFSYTIASAAAARFLGGGWRECLVAGLIGALIGLLATLGPRSRALGNVFAPVSAVLAAAIAQASPLWLSPINPFTATLAGLIVLIPGLTFTTAMIELATGHLASGTARLAHSSSTFLLMTFGLALGTQLITQLGGSISPGLPAALPSWTEGLALLIAPLNFAILFRAHPRHFPVVLAAGLLAYGSARLGGAWLGPQLGGFLAAFLLGCCSNLYTRLTREPAAIPLEPGIIFLVPGTVGLRSLSALLHHDPLAGVNSAFTMVLIALSLVLGLLFANVVLSPKRPL